MNNDDCFNFSSSVYSPNFKNNKDGNYSAKKLRRIDVLQTELNNSMKNNNNLSTFSIFSESVYSEKKFNDYLKKYTITLADLINSADKQSLCFNDDNLNFLSDEPDSESENTVEQSIEQATRTLHEIFVEGCCALYNDLRNLLDDFDTANKKLDYLSDLEKRRCVLMRQANELCSSIPEIADTVQLRLSTLARTMKQLQIRQENECSLTSKFGVNPNNIGQQRNFFFYSNASSASIAQSQFRKWLQASELELESLKLRFEQARNDLVLLQRLRADHQVLQLQIETEGRALLNSAHQQIVIERKSELHSNSTSLESKAKNSESVLLSAKRLDRWSRNLEILEHRWYSHWLANLERVELICQFIEQLTKLDEQSSTFSNESESEPEEPLQKKLCQSVVAVINSSPLAENIWRSKEIEDKKECFSKCNLPLNWPTVPKLLTENSTTLMQEFKSKNVTNSHLILEQNCSTKKNKSIAESRSSGIESFSTPSTSGCASPRYRGANSMASDAEYDNEREEIVRTIDVSSKLCGIDENKPFTTKNTDLKKIVESDKKLSEDGASTASSSRSSNHRFHDVGYSSGENNSLYESSLFVVKPNDTPNSNPVIDLINNDKEQKKNEVEKCGNSPTQNESYVRNYYRTVPLDDGGFTDTETPLFASLLLSSSSEANFATRNNLTDSLIVQVDNGQNLAAPTFNDDESNGVSYLKHNLSNSGLDDFEEVMEIMDEQFKEQLDVLRRGTQWRELKSSTRRNTVFGLNIKPQTQSPSLLKNSSVQKEASCDASSEESDTNFYAKIVRNTKSLTLSLCSNAADLMTSSHNSTVSNIENVGKSKRSRRKRHHKRSNFKGNYVNKTKKDILLLNEVERKFSSKLDNILMDQSIYVTGNSDTEKSINDDYDKPEFDSGQIMMSQSLNLPNKLESNYSTLMSRSGSFGDGIVESKKRIARRKLLRRTKCKSLLDNAHFSSASVNKDLQDFNAQLPKGTKVLETTEIDEKRSLTNPDLKKPTQSLPSINFSTKTNYFVKNYIQPQDAIQLSLSTFNTIKHQRRASIESSHSSSSSTTIHESGDAHYEWDDYRDPCEMMTSQTGVEHDFIRHSTPKKTSSPIMTTLNSFSKYNDVKEFDLTSSTILASSAVIDDVDFCAELPKLILVHSDIDLNDNKNNINNNNDVNDVQISKDDIISILCESRNALTSTKNFIKSIYQNDAKSLQEKQKLLNEKMDFIQQIVQENLNKLSSLVYLTHIELDMHQISEVEQQRSNWTSLMEKYTKSQKNFSKQNSENNKQGKLLSLTTNGSSSGVEDIEIVSLHSILNNMKRQLKLLEQNDGIALSVNDIEKVVETRKEILRSLFNYRDDLRELTAEAQRFKTSTENNSNKSVPFEESDILEMLTLVDLVEKSLITIQCSTVTLEKLKSDFATLCTSFHSLETKIDMLAENGKHQQPSTSYLTPCSKNSCENMQLENSTNEFAKAIEFELKLCQERLDSLETTCIKHSSKLALKIINENASFLIQTPKGLDEPSDILQDVPLQNGNDEHIPQEPIPPKLLNGNTENKSNQQFEFLSKFSNYQKELDRLKDRFKNAVLEKDIETFNNSTTITVLKPESPSSSPNSCRKRRFVHNNIENNENEITLKSIATQSDISSETFRTYEAKIAKARAARAVTKQAFNNSSAESSIALKLPAHLNGVQKNGAALPQINNFPVEGMTYLMNTKTKANGNFKPVSLSNSATSKPHLQAKKLQYSRLAKVCFGCTVLLAAGIFLLALFASPESHHPMLVNNYRWSFGLQLDYVDGAPPV